MKRRRGTRTSRRPPLLVLLAAALAAVVAVVLRRRASADEQRWLDDGYPVEPLGPPEPVQARSDPTPPGPAPAPVAPEPATTEPGMEASPAGEPARDGLAELLALSRQELYARAQARDIPGRSRMSKRELAEALAADGQE